MKNVIAKIKTILVTRSSNAFLLLLTGFFFMQFMLLNVLYINHPLGGWVTEIGTFSTSFVLLTSLLVLSLCLIALWRSVVKHELSKERQVTKTQVVKMRNNYSPIDYPKGSTEPVVSGYVLG